MVEEASVPGVRVDRLGSGTGSSAFLVGPEGVVRRLLLPQRYVAHGTWVVLPVDSSPAAWVRWVPLEVGSVG